MGKAAKFLYLLAGRLKVLGLLDEYSGAAAAYSLRSLSAGTIYVVKVRRSGDNAELDFTATEVSDGTLASWVTAGGGTEDGFVTTWYDQSGNTNNATQATAANQPKIVSSGSLITENGKAAILPNDLTDFLLVSSFSGSADFWMFSVIKVTQSFSAIVYGDNGGKYPIIFQDGSSNSVVSNNSGTPVYYKNGSVVSYATRDEAHDDFLTQSSLTIDADTSSHTNMYIGSYDAGLIGMSKTQELIIYHSDQSANRTDIEGNINDYYNIYS